MSTALQQLSNVVQQADAIRLSTHVVSKSGKSLLFELSCNSYSLSGEVYDKDKQLGRFYLLRKPLRDAFQELHKISGDIVQIDPTSISVKSSKSPVKGKELKALCLDSLYEFFNVAPPSEEAIQAAQQARKKASNDRREQKEGLLALLTAGEVAKWNRKIRTARELAPFQKPTLEGMNLAGIKLVDMPSGNFSKSDLSGASAEKCKLAKADFSQANLSAARFRQVNLKQARFVQAQLDKAEFINTELQGADFSGAQLSGVSFKDCYHDETTVWNKDAMPRKGLIWLGQGVDPVAMAAVDARKKNEGPVDLSQFMKRLEKNIDKARMSKAIKMLKKDSFQLFIDVGEESLTGVVKSQNDPDLVYSCQLTATGGFSCCTQNLNPCGGLRGALCKHILVLIMGLANSGEMDANTLDDWVQRSLVQQPLLDKDVMSAVLLKYKGADAGEIDWRPTETVPEDFYAF